MRVVLILIAFVSYLIAAFSFMFAFGGHGGDMQLVVSGVFGTGGTVALAGAAILEKLSEIAPTKAPEKEPEWSPGNESV